MTRADRILVLLVAISVLVSVPLVSAASARHATTAVVNGPGGRTEIDLSQDRTYEIQGRQGRLILRVSGGRIECEDAGCPDQVCVNTGFATGGRPIVCAPNGVSVTVTANESGALDARSR